MDEIVRFLAPALDALPEAVPLLAAPVEWRR